MQIRSITGWWLKRPEIIFLLLGSLFGIVILFRLYPLGGSDEFTHFPRVFQIQSLDMSSQMISSTEYGGYLPTNIKSMTDDYRDLARRQGQDRLQQATALHTIYAHQKQLGPSTSPTPFTAAAVYSPWSYFPAAIGVLTARSLHLPLLWYVYLGRAFTLFVWLGLVYLAIRLMPIGKWFLFVLVLLPVSITQAVTISPDALVNASSWLLVALCAALLMKKIRLSWWLIVCTALLMLFLCTSKQGYGLVAALPLFLPTAVFKNKKLALYWRILGGSLLLLTSALYLHGSSHIAQIIHSGQQPGIYINSSDQLTYVLRNPIRYIWHALLQPFTLSFDTVFVGFIGILTTRLIYVPLGIVGLLYLALAMSLFEVSSLKIAAHLKEYRAYLFYGIPLATYLAIGLGLYLTFTPVGSTYILGLQGRYFLPLAVFLPLARGFSRKSWFTIETDFIPYFIIPVTLIGLVATSLLIVQ